MNRWFGFLALIALFPGLAAAQDTTAVARPAPAVTLSLQEALDQARANSPTYRQTLNDAGPGQMGSAERLRQPAALGERRLGSGLYRQRPVELRRRPGPAHVGVRTPRATT